MMGMQLFSMIVFHLFRSSMDCAHELLASSKRNLLVIAVPAAVFRPGRVLRDLQQDLW